MRADIPARESGYGSRKCQIRAYEEISSGSKRLARLWASRIAVRAGSMCSSKLVNVVEEEEEEEGEEGLGRV